MIFKKILSSFFTISSRQPSRIPEGWDYQTPLTEGISFQPHLKETEYLNQSISGTDYCSKMTSVLYLHSFHKFVKIHLEEKTVILI